MKLDFNPSKKQILQAEMIHEAILKHVEKFGKEEIKSMVKCVAEEFAPLLKMDPEVFKKNAYIEGSSEFQVVASIYQGFLIDKALKVVAQADNFDIIQAYIKA